MKSLMNISLEKLTLFAIITVGVFYLFVFPPNSAPDESTHFRAAYQNVDAILGRTNDDVESVAIRAADRKMIQKYSNLPDSYTVRFFREELFKPLPEGGEEMIDVKRDSGVPHPYIYYPQTLGMLLGQALHANPEWLYLLGRIFNLIFYAICAWLAVKLTPIGKGVFAVSALLPMSMELAASQSSDTYTIAIAFIAIAQYLRIAYADSPVRWRDFILLLLTMAILGPPKVVFLSFMMLAFFLPGKCFTGKKQALLCRAIVAGVFIATTLIALYVYSHRGDGGVPELTFLDQQTYTIDDLLADPILFAKYCWHTLQTKLGYFLGSMLGTDLGWIEIRIPDALIYVFIALAVIAAFKTTSSEKPLRRRDRIQFPAIFLIVALGMAVIMYVSWTPIGAWEIKGIQGRYFLPAFPLAILFAARWQKPVRPAWLNDKTLLLAACALNAAVLFIAYAFITGRSTDVL